MGQSKKCSYCKKILSLHDFGKCAKGTYGRQGYCKTCQKEKQQQYFAENHAELIEKRIAWRKASKEHTHKDNEACRRWRSSSENYKPGWQAYNRRRRHRVLEMVGKGVLRCVRCGCDKIEFLEINHKFGNGRSDGTNQKLTTNILNGSRSTEDLEITCKLCNNLHYLEMKFGKQPYEVRWKNVEDTSF